MGATIAAEGFSHNGSIAKGRSKLKCLLVLDSEILDAMIIGSGRKQLWFSLKEAKPLKML